MPVIEDIPNGSNFYMVEIVNAIEKYPVAQMSMPFIYKITATVMLRSAFKPSRGLGKNLEGIIEPITVPEKVFRYGLG